MMKDRRWCVYKHTNKINGKIYIGITGRKPEYRWGINGNGYIKNKQYFGNAIEKYGWDEFHHEILFENLTKEEAENLEIDLIYNYSSNNKLFGYNISNGGKCNGSHSDETKEKIRKSKQNPKQSTRKKLSDLQKSRIGKLSANKREVFCNGNYFDTIRECSNYYKVRYQSMCRWLSGDRAMPKKFAKLGLKIVNSDTSYYLQKDNFSGKNNSNSKKIMCDGYVFGAITECCEYYDVKLATMSAWLRGKNTMPQKYIDLGLRYATQEEIDQYIASKEDSKVS